MDTWLRLLEVFLSHFSIITKSFGKKDIPLKEDYVPYDESMKDGSQVRTLINDPITITHSSNAAVPENKQATPFKTDSGRTVHVLSRLIEDDF